LSVIEISQHPGLIFHCDEVQLAKKQLRPGARVGVIDRIGNGENHGVAREIVIKEVREAGYVLSEQYDFVKGDGMDYFLVFTLKP
jgi:hypothetical protein